MEKKADAPKPYTIGNSVVGLIFLSPIFLAIVGFMMNREFVEALFALM